MKQKPKSKGLAPITRQMFDLVKHLPGFDEKQLNTYIYILLVRNGASRQDRVINTRLTNSVGQPIYLLYTQRFDKPISLLSAFIVTSIAHARNLYPPLTQTTMPDPLQWSDNVSDYAWDPSLDINTPSDKTILHIASDRVLRMSGVLSTLSTAVIMRNIRESLSTGREKALRDCAYALPSYSVQDNAVNLLLPLRVESSESELPEAVLLLIRTPIGYRLATVLTPQQAYANVRCFRDPELTWLKGAISSSKS